MLTRLGTPQLAVAAAALLGLGLVMVYSASAIRSGLEFGSSAVYLGRQLEGLALGCAAAAAVAYTPQPWIRRAAPAVWALGTLGVALTLSPLGVNGNGARRWLGIGGFVFQPLEVAKLGVVLGVAAWLAHCGRRVEDWRASIAIPAALAGLPALLLLAQPDFGGAVMLIVFTATLSFVAGARASHLAVTAVTAVPIVAAIAVARPYRLLRLGSFWDPWEDPLGGGYQLVQSLLAFGAGGITGSGLGAGQQKLGYLPEAHTDFILSVVGEELGLIGVTIVFVCFAVVGVAAMGIASRARDPFALLTATGASLLLWLQGAVNAGVVMGVLPTKGMTLPLFSYGRSSLVVSLVAVGLVLNVARPSKRGRGGWR